MTAQGTPTDQIYLTKDAITAFRAELALHLHQYTEASQYAQSLYGTYPLVTTAEGLERMWREDTSTENILQLEVLRTTMTTVNSFGSYLNSRLGAEFGGILLCSYLYSGAAYCQVVQRCRFPYGYFPC